MLDSLDSQHQSIVRAPTEHFWLHPPILRRITLIPKIQHNHTIAGSPNMSMPATVSVTTQTNTSKQTTHPWIASATSLPTANEDSNTTIANSSAINNSTGLPTILFFPGESGNTDSAIPLIPTIFFNTTKKSETIPSTIKPYSGLPRTTSMTQTIISTTATLPRSTTFFNNNLSTVGNGNSTTIL